MFKAILHFQIQFVQQPKVSSETRIQQAAAAKSSQAAKIHKFKQIKSLNKRD